MKNINWELVVVIVVVLALVGAGVYAIVNHVGMNPADGVRLIQYNAGITRAL